ncbi:MAG: hypothetical protein ACT4ON_13025 [Bacteroidota bacterium]
MTRKEELLNLIYSILQGKEGAELTYQVFIEPKGAHLLINDTWKEEPIKKNKRRR